MIAYLLASLTFCLVLGSYLYLVTLSMQISTEFTPVTSNRKKWIVYSATFIYTVILIALLMAVVSNSHHHYYRHY